MGQALKTFRAQNASVILELTFGAVVSSPAATARAVHNQRSFKKLFKKKKLKRKKKKKSRLYIKPLSNVPKILSGSAKWDRVTAAEIWAGGGTAAK